MRSHRNDYRHEAQRPVLTVALIASLCCWAGCAASYSASRTLALEGCLGIGGAAACIALAATCAARLATVKMPAIAAAACALGVFLGSAQAAFIHSSSTALESCDASGINVVLEEDSTDAGFAETACGTATIAGRTATFSCRLPSGTALLRGDVLVADARFKAIDFSEDAYAWNDGSCGALEIDAYERGDAPPVLSAIMDARSRAIGLIGDEDESHALLQALICGYRREFKSTGRYAEAYAAYQTCGLAHLVAVSGAHLVIVTSLFATAFRLLKVPRRLAVVFLIAIMCSYLVMSGMSLSACRATIMSSVGILALFGKRRPSSLNALGVGLFALLVASPCSSVSPSLALSVLSTLGIITFAPLVQSWFAGSALDSVGYVRDGFAMTLSASVLSQPCSCALFSVLPVIAPVANIVCAPLFTLCCGSGLVASVAEVAGVPFASLLCDGASMCARILDGAVQVLSRVPYASIPFYLDAPAAFLATVACGAFLWVAWPRAITAFTGAALCVAFLAGIAIPVMPGDSIVMLDVGQGDACLVKSGGRAVLIDTGNHDSLLKRELARNGVTRLDGVVITHADDDHCGSLDALRQSVHVDTVYMAEPMLECAGQSARKLVEESRSTAERVVGLRKGDRLRIGRFDAEVVWPVEFTEDGGNADSLCLVAEYDGDDDGAIDFTALFTGDAEKDELRRMIESKDVGKVDILKVGHHGSRNGMTQDEVAALEPRIALIGVGKNNRYGHPTGEILEMLEGVSCRTYRTDLDGEVRCTLTPQRVSVECLG